MSHFYLIGGDACRSRDRRGAVRAAPDQFPTKPIRIVLPGAGGSALDVATLAIGQTNSRPVGVNRFWSRHGRAPAD